MVNPFPSSYTNSNIFVILVISILETATYSPRVLGYFNGAKGRARVAIFATVGFSLYVCSVKPYKRAENTLISPHNRRAIFVYSRLTNQGIIFFGVDTPVALLNGAQNSSWWFDSGTGLHLFTFNYVKNSRTKRGANL